MVSMIQAQSYRVSGVVLSEESGEPVPYAKVFVAQTDLGTTANDRGKYVLKGIAPGEYQLSVFAYEAETITKTIRITNANITVDFEMPVLSQALEEVVITEEKPTRAFTRLNSVEGNAIYEAKKTEVVVLDNITANIATNNSRQIYGRVAGLNIWESDGAGVQLGIGGRGLSPNRNSNFNTRQNGYDISADALGYPESYYTPPVAAIERIEIVRGAAGLQYGTQFGGMLNFKFKEGPTDKKIEGVTRQTYGSFGLFNSFNSLGGTVGKVNYYSFYQYKRSDGWRPNSGLNQHTAYLSANYQVSERLSIKPQYTFMTYEAQQPGGLTDAQFDQDPRQSNRERNWFKVDWNLFALEFDYDLTERTTINSRFFGLVAGRDALGNLDRIDRPDFGGNRDFLSDDFRNWGNETRLLHHYDVLGNTSVFLVGTRYYDGFTHRRQGDGPDGNNADFTYLNPDSLEGSDFDLPSKNVSLFAENIFNLTEKFSVTPGIRFEHINTSTNGYYTNRVRDLAGNLLIDEQIPEERSNKRSFVFFGIGTSYKPSDHLEAYANFSQNYRAINFNDIRVNVGNLVVDENLDDERGYNVDLGLRGEVKNFLTFDASIFYLRYQDRIGTVLQSEPDPRFNNLIERTIRFRTNIANADITGFETYAELDVLKVMDQYSTSGLSIFTNFALIRAEYAGSDENETAGNDVELVPNINLKAGINYSWKNLKASYQISYIDEHFSDASNAIRTATAIEGIIPSYQVMDLSLSYSYKWMQWETGVNNLADKAYFTRRATGYPGPGIIPSDGRSFYLTLQMKF